jgi:2-keto-3-deoxy-L-arabinonate dehydratase
MRNLEGVFPILNTTFSDDGQLDLYSQQNLIEHLLEQGAHGLGLLANASEGYTLTAAERVTILKLVYKQVNQRVPLVVSSGHTGTDAAVELSQEAEANGADALMVLPPYFLKTDGDGMMFYFDAISNAVTIPIMVQDAPLMTGVPMPATLLARMAKEIERVRYVKVEAPPTAPKISAVAAQSDIIIFGGLNGQFFIEEVERGARGMMPGSDMARSYVEIWSRLEAGDKEGAWRYFTRILPLIRFELQPGMGVSAMKHNLVAEGIIRSARVRHPTAALDAHSLAELEFLRHWTSASIEPAPVS